MVTKIKDNQFKVQSASVKTLQYVVTLKEGANTCTCPQFAYRQVECKHIVECKMWLDWEKRNV